MQTYPQSLMQLGTRSLLALVIAAPAAPVLANPITEALVNGETSLSARYRYEFVDQDGVDKDAHASTLRTTLGYQTGTVSDFSGFLEFESVTAIGNENFASPTNSVPAPTPNNENPDERPVVADPTETEINQAYLRYEGLPDTNIQYGRQVITLDNHRFIGHVGWRQNQQTFDAATLVNESLADTTLSAGYIYNANRLFSNASPMGNARMRTGFINARYDGLDAGSLTGYSYLLSYSDDPESSTQTYGLRLTGDAELTPEVDGLYELEYAYQDDYDNNPGDFNTDYYKVEGGIATGGVTVKLGREVLGSDSGNTAFSTPLATLHAMNGWADQFLGTPALGLRDTKLSVSGQLQGVNLMAVYHTFESDRGGVDYGTEFGFQATYAFGDHYTVGAKAASYSKDDDVAANNTEDTDKGWLWVSASF